MSKGILESVQVAARILREDTCKKEAGKPLTVRGFASIEGEDRHGQNILAKFFDVDSFMANPQLWYNHDLFRKKLEDGSEIEVPVGVVETMVRAYVEKNGDRSFLVKSMDDDSIVDTVTEDSFDRFIVKNGQRGLWVVVKILEDAVANLVLDGRINAFSWQGVIRRKPDGTIKTIDVWEVSVVFIPANGQALFMVGKTVRWKKGNLFLITDHGLLFPMDDPNAETKNADDMPLFRFVVLDDSGNVTIAKLDTCDIDTAQAYANTLMKDAQAASVAILRATWKRTTDGAAIYHLVDVLTGETPAGENQPEAKVWSKAYVADLPDSSFAFIEPGGNQDSEGKTVPRTLRHFPYKDLAGNIDKQTLTKAITAVSKSAFKGAALEPLLKAADDIGLDVKSIHLKAPGEGLDAIETELLAVATTTKGGDPGMNEKEMAEFKEAVKGMITESVKGITEKVDALAERIPEQKAAETPPAQTTLEVPAAVTAKSEEPPQEDPLSKILVDLATSVKTIGDKVSTLSTRIEKMETVPAESKAPEETAGTITPDSVRKSLKELTPEQRRKAQSGALSNAVFGGIGGTR